MGLSLLLTLHQQKVQSGKLPEVTLRLINEGPEIELVNARMLLVPLNYPERKKEVSFSIEGPPDTINTTVFRVNTGKANSGNFVRLFPGEYIFKDYLLKKYFSYPEPGDYVVQAFYENHLDFTIENLASWTGKIKSNEQHFVVVK